MCPTRSRPLSDSTGRCVRSTLDPTDPEGQRGIGRIGELNEPMTVREFAAQAARGLPPTTSGLRVAGDLDRTVRTIAVSGGGKATPSWNTARRAGVDLFLTADLRHHPASEFAEHGDIALIDAAHWATEWPWLAEGAARLRDALGGERANVEIRVSATATDAWQQSFGAAIAP